MLPVPLMADRVGKQRRFVRPLFVAVRDIYALSQELRDYLSSNLRLTQPKVPAVIVSLPITMTYARNRPQVGWEMQKTLFALVMLLVVVAGSAFGQSIEPNDRILRLSPYFNTQHPIGNGPFPSIVIVTGCSGFHNARFSESYERDEERLLELGYAVTRADFVRAHGIDNSCAGELADAEIAEYITSSVEHVAGLKNVDPNRVYLFGYSLGGTGILTALSHPEIASKIVAVLNYFPRCTGVNTWTARIPMLLMLAELDNIVPPQICKDLVHRVDQPEFIKVVEYPDAHHCFIAKDTPIVTERRTAPTCAYNPQALASSWMDIVDFLESN